MNYTNLFKSIALAVPVGLFLIYPLISSDYTKKTISSSNNNPAIVQAKTIAVAHTEPIEPAQPKIVVRSTSAAQATLASASMYPYRLSIPEIGVNVGVLPMGLESDGKMAVPDNYTEVGWYSLGTKPGQQGSAVMGAHVDNGSTINGVFKNLHTLKEGDDVFVTQQDGTELHYRVTHTKVYDRNEKVTSEVWRSKEGSHLNLITCFGKWLPNENTYEKRIVIFTELI